MKPQKMSRFRLAYRVLFVGAAMLLLVPLSVFAKAQVPISVSAVEDWGHEKDMKLEMRVKLRTEKGIGDTKVQFKVGLNYGEEKEVMMGNRKISFSVNKGSGSPEVFVTIFSKQGTKLHESRVPFNEYIDLNEKLGPNSEDLTQVEIHIKRSS